MAFGPNNNKAAKFNNQLSKNRNRVGLGHAPTFQASGYPWLTGSEVDPSGSWKKVDFPNTVRGFTVRNTDRFYLTDGQSSGSAPIVIFFGPEPASGENPPRQISQNHSYTLREPGDEKRFEIKANHVYIGNMSGFGSSTASTGSFQIFAELTPVHSSSMINLSGSGIRE